MLSSIPARRWLSSILILVQYFVSLLDTRYKRKHFGWYQWIHEWVSWRLWWKKSTSGLSQQCRQHVSRLQGPYYTAPCPLLPLLNSYICIKIARARSSCNARDLIIHPSNLAYSHFLTACRVVWVHTTAFTSISISFQKMLSNTYILCNYTTPCRTIN